MEATLKMKLFSLMVVFIALSSMVEGATTTATQSPAPGPTSAAAVFSTVIAGVASFISLLFGFLLC
ncbi:hypothetical protein IHE45_04G006400 [Dioscorea alata]|uniref:Uncharacterized protein n=1 Tax=Dioscorea alata TaxID=55571 RepID=A0ACB7WAU3_DIOAL|nr:hypothetical protein IHE45_04G006400 [Dioscorea alata]